MTGSKVYCGVISEDFWMLHSHPRILTGCMSAPVGREEIPSYRSVIVGESSNKGGDPLVSNHGVRPNDDPVMGS